MPGQTPAWFEPKFKPGVIYRLQNEGWLTRGCWAEGTTVEGSTVTWKRVSASAKMATPLQPGMSQGPILNEGRDTVSATFVDYEANEFIKKADLNKLSENEQQVAQKQVAMACGRRFDDIPLRIMDADTTNIATVGDGTTAIDPNVIQAVQDSIYDIGAGTYEYCCLLPPSWLSQLQNYREFSSADYVGPEYPLLKQMGARRWRGTTFIPMPSAMFAVPAAGKLDAYFFAKGTLGFEWNQSMSIRPDWLPKEKGWYIAADMACAAQLILPEGIKRLRYATNIALTRPTP